MVTASLSYFSKPRPKTTNSSSFVKSNMDNSKDEMLRASNWNSTGYDNASIIQQIEAYIAETCIPWHSLPKDTSEYLKSSQQSCP